MEIVLGDVNLGVSGPSFSYLFSYQTGGLESLQRAGKQWLFRAPKPTFWRATTCNDRGNGFSANSSCWMGADMFVRTEEVSVCMDGRAFSREELTAPANNAVGVVDAQTVTVVYTYRTTTFIPALVHVSYTVGAQGDIDVCFTYEGTSGLPELPCVGLRFIMPFTADGYTYEGLSGETYPDRKKGAAKGTFDVQGLPVTPYVVPQECGMHMDTTDLVVRHGGQSLHVEMGTKPLPFSLLPYTALELECAYHQDELPPPCHSVLCLYAGVRGVGGINSWGADVEPSYHVDAQQDHSCSFRIAMA